MSASPARLPGTREAALYWVLEGVTQDNVGRQVSLVASSGLQKIANPSTSSYVHIIGYRSKCSDLIKTMYASEDKTFVKLMYV